MRSILTIMLLLLLVRPAMAAEVAYIADMSGKVLVQQPGAEWIAGAIQMRLQEGARVRVEEDARCALVFTEGDFRVILKGPKEVIIQADGPRVGRLESGTPAEVVLAASKAAREEALKTVTDPRAAGSVAAVALRFAGPRRADLLNPTLSWVAGEPLRSVQVAIAPMDHPDRGVVLVELPGSARSYEVPASKLQYGSEYRVHIGGHTESGQAIRYHDTLELVADDTAQWLARRRKAAERDLEDDPDDVSPWIELLNAYTVERLDQRQLEVIDLVLARRADPVQSSRLYRQKIGILMDRGLYDEAMRTYEQYVRLVGTSG